MNQRETALPCSSEEAIDLTRRKTVKDHAEIIAAKEPESNLPARPKDQVEKDLVANIT